MRADIRKQLKKILGKDYACYVLVTCEHPTGDGQMAVEMTSEGDPMLAAYLIDSAQSHIDPDSEYDLPLESPLSSFCQEGKIQEIS